MSAFAQASDSAAPSKTTQKVHADLACLASAAAKWDDRITDATTIAKVAGQDCYHFVDELVAEAEAERQAPLTPTQRLELHDFTEKVHDGWALRAVLTERHKPPAPASKPKR